MNIFKLRLKPSKAIYGFSRAYKRYGFKGVLNYFLSLIDATLRLPFCLAKPTILNITIVEGMCNFSCAICHPAQPGHGKEISFGKFKEILDAYKCVLRIHLCASGEPLMVKDLFKIISYAKEQNCQIGVSTNMSLVDEEMAKKMIASRLDYLCISFDAAEQEMFEEIRKGASFQGILNNIKTLSRLKMEYGLENPWLSFNVTTLRENIYEIPKIVELAAQLGIKEVRSSPLILKGPGADLAVEEQSLTNFPELRQDMFTAAAKRAEELGVTFIYSDYRRHHQKGIDACRQPWNALNVLIDGTLQPCCNYYPAMGNIFSDNIWRVWNNKKFRLIRRMVKKENSICYYCINALNQLKL